MPTIKTLAITDPNVQKVRPGYFLWEAPGLPVFIYISLDVVDRLLQDVMRGFGAVPKRGAEVGGILLGRSQADNALMVEIEDYELIPIEYKRGPSYLLSEQDRQVFTDTYERLRAGAQDGLQPVGMFRSHTREGVGLTTEDSELLDRFFPEDDKISLLIRPFATKVSMAGFYFRHETGFPSGPPLLEFPFRRKELGGGEPAGAPDGRRAGPPRNEREILRGGRESGQDSTASRMTPERSGLGRRFPRAEPQVADGAGEGPTFALSASRRTWNWPLSFLFLLLGLVLGYEAAAKFHPQPAPPEDPFSLALMVAKDGDNLSVRWDRQAAAIKSARHGLLVIQDGPYSKTVDLDPSQLQTGSVVYRHSTKRVKFRLEIQVHDHAAMSETFDWVQ